MIKLFKLLCFCISLCVCNAGYSVTLSKAKHNFNTMSCDDLMLGLVKESSYNKVFSDKKLGLEFGFERYNERYLMIVFVQRNEQDRAMVYANFELDLVKVTLKKLDPDPPVPIKINAEYIPFIANKCTPDQNLYINTSALPDQ